MREQAGTCRRLASSGSQTNAGARLPDSHCDQVELATPRLLAACFWESPRHNRQWTRFAAKVLGSAAILVRQNGRFGSILDNSRFSRQPAATDKTKMVWVLRGRCFKPGDRVRDQLASDSHQPAYFAPRRGAGLATGRLGALPGGKKWV